jgi:hypothetical protein
MRRAATATPATTRNVTRSPAIPIPRLTSKSVARTPRIGGNSTR